MTDRQKKRVKLKGNPTDKRMLERFYFHSSQMGEIGRGKTLQRAFLQTIKAGDLLIKIKTYILKSNICLIVMFHLYKYNPAN